VAVRRVAISGASACAAHAYVSRSRRRPPEASRPVRPVARKSQVLAWHVCARLRHTGRGRGWPARRGPLPACPPTSPALFYWGDTLGQMSDPPLPGGAVVISANDSPLGARNIPKDGPLVTVKLPVQSGLTV